MKDAAHTGCLGVTQHREGVIFGVPCVQHDGPPQFGGEGKLCAQHAPLLIARYVVVVVVEATLADTNRAAGDRFAYRRSVTRGIPGIGIVRMYPARVKHDAGVARRNGLRPQCGRR